jgi:hypothetical protein
MMDRAFCNEISNLAQDINAVALELDNMKATYADLRLKALQTVTTTKVGNTITLESGNRIIKAKKNVHGRFKVTEGKKTLINEYMGGGIHDLRFDIAMGKV